MSTTTVTAPRVEVARGTRLVEVVVPVHNERRVLARSVHRLHAYLTRTFPYGFRTTIAGNVGTDKTWQIAAKLTRELPHVRAVRLEEKDRAPRRPAPPSGPRWARPAMWGVLALAAVLYTWALGRNGYANDYYSAAVWSGTQSWKAFFFGALDSGSYITVDKPPLALWVMGLSARIFGFGTWSMLLPQAAAGVAAVALVHSAVRRALDGPHAHVAALIAALVMTLTPITVAINRDNNPDTLLVLLLVAAAWLCLEAVHGGRTRPLLGAALLVGLAFNTKMLQAYLVLPAFAGVYLLAAPGRPARRIGR
ncbi:glycosyltransferase family 39 protein, partial [Nonomuraea rhizosphaerae]|uniref:glycosyltransferase family 39 protein n=1 Tax=Nonomuraea rhizosphaerae TaxID=2665663 RepID=UPI001FEAFFEC